MSFLSKMFGKEKEESKAIDEDVKAEDMPEEMIGCDCAGCPSAGSCPGEEMKEAIKEEEK